MGVAAYLKKHVRNVSYLQQYAYIKNNPYQKKPTPSRTTPFVGVGHLKGGPSKENNWWNKREKDKRITIARISALRPGYIMMGLGEYLPWKTKQDNGHVTLSFSKKQDCIRPQGDALDPLCLMIQPGVLTAGRNARRRKIGQPGVK